MIEIDYSQLTPIILHGGAIREGVRFLAIVVPNTDGLLAVDERYPGNSTEFDDDSPVWAVTHIPTMRRMQRTGYTNAETEGEAFALASRFYAVSKRIGLNLAERDLNTFLAPYSAMDEAAKEAFWAEIKGSVPAKDSQP
jgi:hypothetical protein